MQTLSKAARTLNELTNPRPKIPRAELATELGVSVSAIGEWCRGQSRPSPDNMKKLADRIPPGDWFVDEPGEPAAGEDS